MTSVMGYSRERCLLALRGYWDEMDTLQDELERLAEADHRAVRGCQVQFEQLLRDLDADLEVRIGAQGDVRLTEVETQCLLPALRAARAALGDLPEHPDRSWAQALHRAQLVIQEASRELARGGAVRAGTALGVRA